MAEQRLGMEFVCMKTTERCRGYFVPAAVRKTPIMVPEPSFGSAAHTASKDTFKKYLFF